MHIGLGPSDGVRVVGFLLTAVMHIAVQIYAYAAMI
jgi:hypothetical protein